MDFLTAFSLNLDIGTPDVVTFVGGGGKSAALFGLANAIAARGHRVITTSTTHLDERQVVLAPITVRVMDEVLPLEQIVAALAKCNHCLLIGPSVTHDEASAVQQPSSAAQRVKGISLPLINELVNQSAQLGISALLIEGDGSKRRPAKAPAHYEPVIPLATTMLVTVMGLDAIGRPITNEFVHRPELMRQLLDAYLPPTAANNIMPQMWAPDGQARLTAAMAAHILLHPNGGTKGLPAQARHILLLNKAESSAALALGRLIVHALAPQAAHCLIGAAGALPDNPIRERWAPLGVAVLAAGQSRRMGSAKQLATADGEAMIVRAARVALASGAAQIVVVTGAYAEQVEARLRAALASDFERLHLVHNPEWTAGQATSVRCAIQSFESTIAAAAIMPVDQPFLSSFLLQQIFQQWRWGAQMVAPTVQSEMRGAPALFDRTLWPELAMLDGDVGARVILRRHLAEVATVEAPARQLQDVDTPEDLARLASIAPDM